MLKTLSGRLGRCATAGKSDQISGSPETHIESEIRLLQCLSSAAWPTPRSVVERDDRWMAGDGVDGRG